MTFKRALLIFGILSSLFSCNKDNSSDNSNFKEGVYFLSNTYSEGAAVWHWNPTTGALARVASDLNADWKLFFDAQSQEPVVLQRRLSADRAALPSVLVRYRALTSTKPLEVGGVAKNSYDVASDGDRYIVAGWNNGELSVIDRKSLAKAITTTPQGLPEGVENQRFVGTLQKGATLFTISGGTRADFTPTAAKLHRLSADRSRVEQSWDIPNCSNIFGAPGNDGFVRLEAAKAVVTCNGQGLSQEGQSMAVTLVDVTSETPELRILSMATSSKAHAADYVRGLSTNKNAVFVEEMGGDYPYAAQSRYWLSLTDGGKTPVTGFGGSFTTMGNQYIFSCLGEKKCARKTFVTLPEGLPTTAEGGKATRVEFDYQFQAFATEI